MHSPSSRRKYLVEIHAYENHLYTADFYAEVNNVNRYRLRTNQQAAGKLGGIVLAILAEVLWQDLMYTKMLELKLNPMHHRIVAKEETSSIFVLAVELAAQPAALEAIILRYEDIFAEAF